MKLRRSEDALRRGRRIGFVILVAVLFAIIFGVLEKESLLTQDALLKDPPRGQP